MTEHTFWRGCLGNKFKKQKKKEHREENATQNEEQNEAGILTMSTTNNKKTPIVKIKTNIEYDEDNNFAEN
jgi:hypothetical protein